MTDKEVKPPKKVIPYSRVPAKFPSVFNGLVFPIIQNHYDWPDWTLGVFYTLYAVAWIASISAIVEQTQVDPFNEDSK